MSKSYGIVTTSDSFPHQSIWYENLKTKKTLRFVNVVQNILLQLC